MVNFSSFRLAPAEEKIMNKLVATETLFIPRAQFELFKNSVNILMSGGKTAHIQQVVSDVARSIKGLGPVLIKDQSTHVRRQEQIEILTTGLATLESIQPGTYTAAQEETAIKEDAHNFQRGIELVSIPQPSGSILVHDMVNPATEPLKLPPFSKCRQVRRYLQSKRLAESPELWARYHDKQPLTPSGLWWEWLPLNGDVQGKYLEFVNRADGTAVGDYIVVLKFVKNQEEVPQPIDIARLGSPCCSARCRNLQAHLEAIWPNQMVTQAFKIENGSDVLSETFDDSLFDPRTNDLCVHLE